MLAISGQGFDGQVTFDGATAKDTCSLWQTSIGRNTNCDGLKSVFGMDVQRYVKLSLF